MPKKLPKVTKMEKIAFFACFMLITGPQSVLFSSRAYLVLKKTFKNIYFHSTGVLDNKQPTKCPKSYQKRWKVFENLIMLVQGKVT